MRRNDGWRTEFEDNSCVSVQYDSGFLRQVPRLHDYLRGNKGLNGFILKEFRL
jgi:hypothetical protein